MLKDSVARFTLTLPKVTKDLIDRLAEIEGISSSAMMQRLLEGGLTIEALRMEGGELIGTFPDGRTVTIANNHGRFMLDSRKLDTMLKNIGGPQ